MGRDFAETNVILRILVDFARAATKVRPDTLLDDFFCLIIEAARLFKLG